MRRIAPLVVLVLVLAGCGNGDKKKPSSCPASTGTAFDADADLLTDSQEARLGTDPAEADSDGDGFGDYVESMAGTDPLAEASVPSGQVASVREIANAGELIGGPGAIGAVGDWLLENDRIRAIVQAPGAEQMQVGTYGGNLIDADIVRPVGEPGNDSLGMIIPLFSFQQTFRASRAVVVNDGSDGGAAILRTCGKDDTYEYLDLFATIKLFAGIGIKYPQNPNFDMDVSTEYTLAPGSDRVEVVTTLHNHGKRIRTLIGDVIESGSAQEIFNTNNQGFGTTGFGDVLDDQPPTSYMGFQSPGSSWGYVPDAPTNVAVTVSGVTVAITEFASALEAVGSNPEDEGAPIPGLHDINKGKKLSWHRTIVVGDASNGLADVAESYYEKQAVAPVEVAGTVADGTGPLGGARITLLSNTGVTATDRVPLAATVSSSDGSYAFSVPPGNYYIAADFEGRNSPIYSTGATTITTRKDGNLVDAASVTVAAAGSLPDITFEDASIVSIDVTHAATAAAVPARVSIVGTDPSPSDTIFRDPKERTASAVPHHALLPAGSVDLALEPGIWTIYASHGMEWSRASTTVTAVAGATTSASLVIGPVIDTTGWISADFHVHMQNSPDSPVPFADRVNSAVVEGLDVIVATDHDYITDLAPTIATLGVGNQVAAVPGEEITTWAMGHFNMWPLTPDPFRPADGGAYKWAGGEGAVSHRTLQQIFEDMGAAHVGPQVRQVNHPRDNPTQGYYTAIHLDTATLESFLDPSFIRVPPVDGYDPEAEPPMDSQLFYSQYDAQEVLNGGTQPLDLTWAYMNDLFTMLSHGFTLVGTGNSDTHKVFAGQLGWPRNYVEMPDDSPANLPANLTPFAASIQGGQTFFTTGPFVRVTATGATAGGPGDMIEPNGGSVTLSVDLEMPDWIDVDTMNVYVNTPNTTALRDEDGLRQEPVAQYTVNLAPLIVTTSAGNGLSKKRALDVTQVVDVSGFATDAWIVVTITAEATATSLFPVIPVGTGPADGTKPFALVNAIYVDMNGNATYDPPSPVAASASAARPSTGKPMQLFDEINDANKDDIRAQWKALSRGACAGHGIEHDHRSHE